MMQRASQSKSLSNSQLPLSLEIIYRVCPLTALTDAGAVEVAFHHPQDG